MLWPHVRIMLYIVFTRCGHTATKHALHQGDVLHNWGVAGSAVVHSEQPHPLFYYHALNALYF